jgi:hypothetical protein
MERLLANNGTAGGPPSVCLRSTSWRPVGGCAQTRQVDGRTHGHGRCAGSAEHTLYKEKDATLRTVLPRRRGSISKSSTSSLPGLVMILIKRTWPRRCWY